MIFRCKPIFFALLTGLCLYPAALFAAEIATPSFVSATIAPDNSYVDVTFSEGIYNSGLAGIDGGGSDFRIGGFNSNGGNVTNINIVTITQLDGVSAPAGGESSLRFFLSFVGGPASGVESFRIRPDGGGKIFDLGGANSMNGGAESGDIILNPLTEPTVQTCCIAASNIGPVSADINWTLGNGTYTLLLIREAGPVGSDPTDFVTYNWNTDITLAENLGSGIAVYGGTNSSTTITGLNPSTTYFLKSYSFNGAAGSENYLITTAPETSFTTSSESVQSDIIYDLGFASTVDIPYIDHTDPAVTIVEHHLAQFTIRDGGFLANDTDTQGTTLTDITLSFTNWANLKDVAIFNSSNTLLESGTISGPSISFGGLSLTAPDNGETNFLIVCTFQTTVTDNSQIIVSITDATSQIGGSIFSAADAGGASSLPTINYIEVVATEMVFTTEPETTINVTTDFATPPVVVAQDANGNQDLDFSEGITVDTPMSLNLSNPPTTFASGVLTFPANFQYVEAGDGTLTVSGSITAAVSTAVTVNCIDPVIAPVITHVTDCTPDNGGVTTTLEVDGVPQPQANFTFEWFSGTSNIPANTLGIFTGDISNLAPGDYYVEATYNVTGCIGGAVVTINDARVLPVLIEASNVSNTTCVGTPSGSVTLDISGQTLSDYTFEWFEGSTTVTPLGTTFGAVGGVDNEIAMDLPAGDVTVRVTDNTTPGAGCVVTSTYTITDAIATVTIDNADVTLMSNTTCSDPHDGVATVGQIREDGVPFSPDGYFFEWLEPDGITPIATGSGLASLVTLAPGSYFIKVTNNTTGCESALYPFTIDDLPALPVLSETISANTSCAAPDGSVDISIDGGANIANYTITWYQGTDNTGIVIGNNIASVTSLDAGSYFVEVTTNSNSCLSSGVYVVPDATDVPSSGVLTGGGTICSGATESIKVDIVGGVAPFSVVYNDGSGNLQQDGYSTGADITVNPALSGSTTYTLVSVTDSKGCTVAAPSGSAVFTVQDITVTEDLNTASTACIAPYNGAIVVSVGGTSDFTAAWTGPNGFTSASTSISSLEPGSYALTITDNSTTCSTIFNTTIADNSALPVLSVSSTENTSCITPNGSVTVSIDGGASASLYSIVWYEGTDNTGPIVGNSATTIDLASGNYFVEVTNNSTGCLNSAGVVISETAVPPALVLAGTSDNTSCSTPDGSASITIDGGSDPNPFFITWKDSNDNTVATNTLTLTGVFGGDYLVEVVRNGTDCISTLDVTVSDAVAIPSTPSLSSDNTGICVGTTLNLFVTITGGTAPYTVTIDNGVGTISNYSSDDAIPVTPTETTTYLITSLVDAGGCSPASLPNQGLQISVDPAIQIFEVRGGGALCGGTSEREAIQLGGSQSGVGYSLQLDGQEVDSRLGNGNSLVFNVIPEEGEYTIQASTANNCTEVMNGSAIFEITDKPTINGSISGDIEFCQGAEALTYSVEDPGADFFTWSLPSGFTIIDGKGTAQITVSTGRDAESGDIVVTASNDCGTSDPVSLTVTSNAAPLLTIQKESEIRAGDETTFSVTSNVELESVLWDFGDGGVGEGESVTYTYPDRGNYVVEVAGTSVNGCTGTGTNPVLVLQQIKIVIKNVVTPNGDGQNDVLWIENIEDYPDNELSFLDRWGVEVANFQGYQNTWDLRTQGEYIPAGNYLCVVRLGDGDVYSMTVTVIRN